MTKLYRVKDIKGLAYEIARGREISVYDAICRLVADGHVDAIASIIYTANGGAKDNEYVPENAVNAFTTFAKGYFTGCSEPEKHSEAEPYALRKHSEDEPYTIRRHSEDEK